MRGNPNFALKFPKYTHITLEYEKNLAREHFAVQIAADPVSDHTDFPLRNFTLFRGDSSEFSQNKMIEDNPFHPRVILEKSRF